MFIYLKNICQFMWLLITDKCRIINLLPTMSEMPEMRDNSYGLVHNNDAFIDYKRTRYIKTDIVVSIILQSQATSEETIFKKLRENSSVNNFMPKCSFNTICGICIEKMKKNDIVRELSCKHSFHIDCIDQWFEKKCCCPYCNQAF